MAAIQSTQIALRVPDPSLENYPVGWWQDTALPVVLSAESWDDLDEMEAQLLAMASFIEAKGRDSIELEKALRIVEKRRGDIAGVDAKPGPNNCPTRGTIPDDVSRQTLSRYRTIARYWDDLIYPHLLNETNRRAVTQTALLNLIASKIADGEVVGERREFHWIQAVSELRASVERRIAGWPDDARHLAPKALRELADILEKEVRRAS